MDPVVVSSCIFMEDEQSESRADGIIENVSTFVSHDLDDSNMVEVIMM